jgi:acetoin utilization protein AcuB
MQIQELNYASLPWIQQSDSVASAMQRMEDEQLKQLPVVEGEHYVGLLNMDLLLSAEDDSLSIQQIIHLLPKPLIHPEEHFLAAVQIVAEQSLQLIPVVSAEGELQGVVEETELMSAVAAFLGLHENGALLVVEKEIHQYSASEVVKLVETNDVQVMQLNTRLNAQAGTMLITLRLNRTEISDIISTFQRYEYTIRFFIGEEQYANELRANYNNLIHYLKI